MGEVSGFTGRLTHHGPALGQSRYNDKGKHLHDGLFDITKRKRMEEEYQRTPLSINGIGISDLEGTSSTQRCRFKNVGAADASRLSEHLHSASPSQRKKRCHLPDRAEGRMDGRGRDFARTAHPSRSCSRRPGLQQKGEPIYMMDSFVDITERKRMEESRQPSPRRSTASGSRP